MLMATTALAAEAQPDYRTFSERRQAAATSKLEQTRISQLTRVGEKIVALLV